jgi:RNA polymerase sigma factor (sigma-70 family)
MTTQEEAKAILLPLMDPLKRELTKLIAEEVRKKIDVEDIVQEAYFKAVQAYGKAAFEHQTKVFPWFLRIAKNHACDLLKRRKPGELPPSRYAVSLAHELIHSGELSPEEVAVIRDNQKHLWVAMQELKGEWYREVIELRYMEQLTFEEIAIRLDTSAARVRGIHKRALETLRTQLGNLSRYLSSR